MVIGCVIPNLDALIAHAENAMVVGLNIIPPIYLSSKSGFSVAKAGFEFEEFYLVVWYIFHQ